MGIAKQGAQEILDLIPAPFDPGQAHQRFLDLSRKYAIRLTGDTDRDITRIEARWDDPEHYGCWYEGLSEQGVRRVSAGVLFDSNGDVDMELRVTKENVDAGNVFLGQSGLSVGNRVLTARLFHLSLLAFRGSGVRAFCVRPIGRARDVYLGMGFEPDPSDDRDLVFRLDDRHAIEVALDYVHFQYQRFGLDLTGIA